MSELQDILKTRESTSDDEHVSFEIPSEFTEFVSTNTENSDEIQRFCRVCLLAYDTDMTSIYCNNDADNLLDKLKYFTGLEVRLNDRLPCKVCGSCKKLIEQCYLFKLKCEHSELTLKSFLPNIYCDEKEDAKDNITLVITKIEDSFEYENKFDETSDCDIKCGETLDCDTQLEDVLEFESISDEKQQHKKLSEPFVVIEKISDPLLKVKRAKALKKNLHSIRRKKIKRKEHENLDFKNEVLSDYPILCKICGKNCKNERGLLRHTVLAHKDYDSDGKRLKCPSCDSAFICEDDLNVHRSVHSETLQCSRCKKEFTTLIQLKRHVKRHMVEKAYSCEACDKTYTEVSALHKHQRSHDGTLVERKHACQLCKKRFVEKNELRVHMRHHTGERPFACNECGRKFASIRLLNSHSMTHENFKRYQCETCHKSFRHSTTLASHTRTHTGARPFVCYKCGKSFAQNSNLMMHMRIHSDERPYSCKECNKSFKQLATMKAHEKIHTGDSCNICGKRLTRQNMRAHMQRHATKTDIACNTCDKSFTTNKILDQHTPIHSNPFKCYECEFCGQKMKKKSSLVRHVKRHQIGATNKISQMTNAKNSEQITLSKSDTGCLQICDYVAGTETVKSVVKEELLDAEKETIMITEMTSFAEVPIDNNIVIIQQPLLPLSSQKLYKIDLKPSDEF